MPYPWIPITYQIPNVMVNSTLSQKQHILALAPNWLGDAAMCTPALRALHRRYPEAHFTVAGRESVCALLEDMPWINHLIPLPPKPSLSRMRQLATGMRYPQLELIAVFPHAFRSALLAWLIGGRQRLGYARNGRKWLLTRSKAPYREQGRITPIYMAREYLELVELADCKDDGEGLELGVCPNCEKELADQLDDTLPLIGVAPGAAFGPSKRWLPENFAATINNIADAQEARFILLTGPGEEALCHAIKANARATFVEPETSYGGITRLKTLIAKLDLLICNDSGPRHIAVAFKRPLVCIMGPTSKRYTNSPYEIGEVLQASLDCIPCQEPTCPLGHHQCMKAITPKQVTEAALRILEKAHRTDKD